MADSLDIYIVQFAGEIQGEEVFTLLVQLFCGRDNDVTITGFELYSDRELSHLCRSCYGHWLAVLLKVLLITNVKYCKVRANDSICEWIWRVLSISPFRTTVKLSQGYKQLTIFYRLEQVLWIFSEPKFSLCSTLYWQSARAIAAPVRLISYSPPFVGEVVGNEKFVKNQSETFVVHKE